MASTEGYTHLQEVAKRITETLKELLEQKHLYQSITVNAPEDPAGRDTRALPVPPDLLGNKARGPWMPVATDDQVTFQGIHNPWGREMKFRVPDVQLFCSDCDRKHAFNYLRGQDAFQWVEDPQAPTYRSSKGVVQAFFLTFLCQACKKIPETFLVRREDYKLTLSGRAPMEAVQIPIFVPRVIRKFYGGAVVAFQSGQTLAALFMLRVTIEQWALAFSQKIALKADEAIQKYMDGLPPDFKGRFPSLGQLYGELSADIHSAAASEALFVDATTRLNKHFDGYRVYELPQP